MKSLDQQRLMRSLPSPRTVGDGVGNTSLCALWESIHPSSKTAKSCSSSYWQRKLMLLFILKFPVKKETTNKQMELRPAGGKKMDAQMKLCTSTDSKVFTVEESNLCPTRIIAQQNYNWCKTEPFVLGFFVINE